MTAYNNNELFNALSEIKAIDESQLKDSLKESEEKNIPFGDVLLEKELINDENLGLVIGDLLSIPYINLSKVAIPENVLQLIPESVANAQRIIAFKIDSNGLHIATEDPSNKQILKFLGDKSGMEVIVYYTTHTKIKNALSLYSKKITTAFEDLIKESINTAKKAADEGPPIRKIVDTMITYANQNSASDIHIEPLEDSTLVRFRIDGMMHDVVSLPPELDPQIVTRIKVMANLRTDEHQETQDGKISFKVIYDDNKSDNLDIRVSVAPVVTGEKIVMRLLSERSRNFSIEDLGLQADAFKKVNAAYQLPHGMILATGPTGSGKTTTLYAILKQLNKREVNIMTIEDPVEYQIENVNQMQVNPKADFTFSKGLRSIVRQDPDIILVGEVRDSETAGIAINSAMTGHLVLSTLHTNDAVTTFPRLIDMGIEPYLVASTVNVVIAQRLIRKICSKCKTSIEINPSELDIQFKKYFTDVSNFHIFHGKGCDICNYTGYTGRIGIFEVLIMDENLRQAVTEKSNADELKKLAINSGMKTMLEDGVEKVKLGITTIEELLRVTKE